MCFSHTLRKTSVFSLYRHIGTYRWTFAQTAGLTFNSTSIRKSTGRASPHSTQYHHLLTIDMLLAFQF